MIKMTVVTMIVITIMLALVYRSPSVAVLRFQPSVGIEMGAARGAVAVVGHPGIMDFSDLLGSSPGWRCPSRPAN